MQEEPQPGVNSISVGEREARVNKAAGKFDHVTSRQNTKYIPFVSVATQGNFW